MGDAEAGCKEVLARLYQFLDAELGEVDLVAVRRHLEVCRPCMDHATFERAFKELVRRTCCEREPPEGLAERLRARLRGLEA